MSREGERYRGEKEGKEERGGYKWREEGREGRRKVERQGGR